jgi:hypothetical protein
MQVPLPTGPAQPYTGTPVLSHNEGDYRYEMFADLSVAVYKEGQLTYTVDIVGCECPGFKHRGTCKHFAQRERMVAHQIRKGQG